MATGLYHEISGVHPCECARTLSDHRDIIVRRVRYTEKNKRKAAEEKGVDLSSGYYEQDLRNFDSTLQYESEYTGPCAEHYIHAEVSCVNCAYNKILDVPHDDGSGKTVPGYFGSKKSEYPRFECTVTGLRHNVEGMHMCAHYDEMEKRTCANCMYKVPIRYQYNGPNGNLLLDVREYNWCRNEPENMIARETEKARCPNHKKWGEL